MMIIFKYFLVMDKPTNHNKNTIFLAEMIAFNQSINIQINTAPEVASESQHFTVITVILRRLHKTFIVFRLFLKVQTFIVLVYF